MFRNVHTVPRSTAEQLLLLAQGRVAAGLATAQSEIGDDDRFCGCGNLLRPGTIACGECEPVNDVDRTEPPTAEELAGEVELKERADAWAELQRGDLAAVRRRLTKLVGATPVFHRAIRSRRENH